MLRIGTLVHHAITASIVQAIVASVPTGLPVALPRIRPAITAGTSVFMAGIHTGQSHPDRGMPYGETNRCNLASEVLPSLLPGRVEILGPVDPKPRDTRFWSSEVLRGTGMQGGV